MIQNAFIASNGLIVNGNTEINGDLTVSGFAYASASYAITASYALSYSGTSGTSGTSGANGSSGASGTDGSSGTSGANGSSGASGTDGSSGTSGANGSSGASGTDGSSGTSGANGSSGTDGSSGTSGASGSSGSSGTDGSSGTSGSSGSSGNTGASGSGGSSGSSGTSGANGTSGSSGSSGISGGTSNYVAKFSAATTLTTSSIFDNATNVGIGTSSPNAKLDVYGDTIITGSLSVTGNITAIGNVTGQTLISTNASGNEGGEIQLAKSPNSILSGSSVIIDQYADRVRIFESGGSSRGAYIDLTLAASNVGTLLNNRSSGFVNAGVDVTLGNLKVRMSTSGNRSLQVSTVSGTYSVYGSGVYSYNGVAGSTIDAASPRAISTTPTYIAPGYTFATAGATDTWMLMDTSNAIAWRITLIVGGGYLNNMISIERLV